MDPNIKQSIIDRLKQTNNVLVTVKNNPSVDQLAACIGLTLFLNKLGKHATAVFSGAVPSTIEFLKPEATLEKDTNSLRDFIIALDKSKADKLRYKVEDKVVKIFITPYRTSLSQDDLEFSQGDFNVDVVMALGVHAREELDQAIVAHGRILHDATVVSVNCGKTADLGALNWNDDKASSLCEMVAGLVDLMQANTIDAQMATAFLTGIVAETDRFSNPKTTSTTMSISAKLMASGANQQLVASRLQQPMAPADNKKEGESNDGTLEIEHAKKEDAELPSPIDDDSTILIDDDGNLKTGLQDESVTKEDQSTKTGRLTLQPPTLGSRLTANTEEDKENEPTSDPLSDTKHNEPILEHKQPLGIVGSKSNEAPKATPNISASNKIDITTNQTLADIEEQLDSPHASSVNTFTPPQPKSVELPSASAPPALNDPLSQNSSNDDLSNSQSSSISPPLSALPTPPQTQPPVFDTSNSVPQPAMNDLPAASGIDDARKAVEAAAQASMAAPTEPIQALNAQPLSDNLNSQSLLPGQQTSPQPNELGLNLPPNLVPPDQGLPPEQTGTSQPPTSPPPVPPPMMPPGF